MIGLDGTGMRASPGSEKVKRTRSVEPSGSGMKVMSHSKSFRSAYERRSNNKKVSMLLVCAAAIIIVSGMSLASLGDGAHTKAGTQAMPVASFTATVSGGFTVSVDASASTGTGPLSYAWNYGDMITQNGLTASHSYVTTESYTITLTVTDSLGQKGTATKSVDVANPNPPPFTFSLYGTTFASDGVTPLGGCMVNITDVRTGTTLIGTVSDANGVFVGDISPLYQLPGDTIVVNAIGPAGQTGSGSGVIVGTPYLGIDVTLGTVIPEFTDIAIPIVGMIAIFAVARVASSRRKEE
jgi:PKD repeat protein